MTGTLLFLMSCFVYVRELLGDHIHCITDGSDSVGQLVSWCCCCCCCCCCDSGCQGFVLNLNAVVVIVVDNFSVILFMLLEMFLLPQSRVQLNIMFLLMMLLCCYWHLKVSAEFIYELTLKMYIIAIVFFFWMHYQIAQNFEYCMRDVLLRIFLIESYKWHKVA